MTADHAGPQHKLMADDFSIAWGFFQRGQVETGSSHKCSDTARMHQIIDLAHYSDSTNGLQEIKRSCPLLAETLYFGFGLGSAFVDFFAGEVACRAIG